MLIILLDTNFLMVPYQHKIDIFSEIERLISEEYKLVTFTGVIRELENIRQKSTGKEGIAAKVALELIENKNVEVEESKGKIDEAIVNFANEKKTVVCTNDKELKRRLRKLHIPRICMVKKDHLMITE